MASPEEQCMKIGLTFFPVRPEILLPLAQHADRLRYDSIMLGEHLAFPVKITSQYPYNRAAGQPLTTTPLFDPLLTFAYIAGQTQNIQMCTSIYIAALRHPVVVAKLVATLDALSGGRLLFGVGVGWQKEEFDVVGEPWEHRGSRTEEMIHIMRRLWTEARVEHRGKFYQFDEMGFEPKPVRRPVPVLLSGETPIAIKRAARLGDGWIGAQHTVESAAARVKEFRALRGRDDGFEITVSPLWVPSVDDARRFQEAGVHRLMISPAMLMNGPRSLEASLDDLSRFAETVMLPTMER
jgi:probable F420-dependent oxidoreductase